MLLRVEEKQIFLLRYASRGRYLGHTSSSVVVSSLSEHRRADANNVITLIDGGLKGILPTPHTSYRLYFTLVEKLLLSRGRHLRHGYREQTPSTSENSTAIYIVYFSKQILQEHECGSFSKQ